MPSQTAGETGGEEPLPLDRGTLQTLLAVDGRRSVREIVALRHSIETVWHLASLADVGLIHFNGTTSSATAPTDPALTPTVIARAPTVDPAMQDTVIAPLFAPTTSAPPASPPPVPEAPASAPTDHCPKLGFEDDPANSFGRPTRLHRCYAAGSPIPLSLDQQRELCLSDHFGTCPRLTATAPPTTPQPRGAWPTSRRVDSAARDDGRIVRPPFGVRAATTERNDARGASTTPTPLRATPPPAGAGDQQQAAATAQPTPLYRGVGSSGQNTGQTATPRAEAAAVASAAPTPTTTSGSTTSASTRSVSTTATTVPSAAGEASRDAASTSRHEQARAAARTDVAYTDGRRRIGQIPVVALAAAGAVVLLVAALGYLLLPQLITDTSVDDGSLPNARRAAEGTPVTALVSSRATPIVVATVVPDSAVDVDGAQVSQPTGPQPTAPQPTAASVVAQGGGAPSAAQPTSAAAVAAAAVGAGQATSAPTPQTASATGGTNQSATSTGQSATAAAQPTAPALFDERFTTNDVNWPSNPQGVGQFTNGSYRMTTRQAGQSATIGAPIARLPGDVQVTADFRKLGGPDGGGYGIIVRDQQQGVRDGSSQDGRYYVLEAGDKGEVGIWRRDGDHWVDLVPWQHADAVRPGTAPNELTVRAVGNTLSLLVNGAQVATKQDAALTNGQVGLFVGGDGNQVAITRFTVDTP